MNLPIMRRILRPRPPYLVNKHGASDAQIRATRLTTRRPREKAARPVAAPLTCPLDNLLGKTRSDGFNDDRDTRITRRNLTKEINADAVIYNRQLRPTAD